MLLPIELFESIIKGKKIIEEGNLNLEMSCQINKKENLASIEVVITSSSEPKQ